MDTTIGKLIEEYIGQKEVVWSPTTYKSQRSWLAAIRPFMEQKTPVIDVLKELRDNRKFQMQTIRGIFGAARRFNRWRGLEHSCSYAAFMKDNSHLFAAHRIRKLKEVPHTFEEAKRLIDTIKNPRTRAHARFILSSGVRISESYNVKPSPTGRSYIVTGKGGRTRTVFAAPPPAEELASPDQLRTALKKFGLVPHDLRRLFATHLADSGLPPKDICHALGWGDLKTAMIYLQKSNEKQLAARIGELV